MSERYYIIEAMKKFGGSFVQALGECLLLADDDNFQRLMIAFPEYIKKYQELGKSIPRE